MFTPPPPPSTSHYRSHLNRVLLEVGLLGSPIDSGWVKLSIFSLYIFSSSIKQFWYITPPTPLFPYHASYYSLPTWMSSVGAYIFWRDIRSPRIYKLVCLTCYLCGCYVLIPIYFSSVLTNIFWSVIPSNLTPVNIGVRYRISYHLGIFWDPKQLQIQSPCLFIFVKKNYCIWNDGFNLSELLTPLQ